MKLLKIGDSVKYTLDRGSALPMIMQGVAAFIRTGYWLEDGGEKNVNAVEYPDGDSRITMTDGTIIRGDQVI